MWATKAVIKISRIDPRYDIYYFFDNIFILYLILSPQMITPGLDLSTDARGQWRNLGPRSPQGREGRQQKGPEINFKLKKFQKKVF